MSKTNMVIPNRTNVVHVRLFLGKLNGITIRKHNSIAKLKYSPNILNAKKIASNIPKCLASQYLT